MTLGMEELMNLRDRKRAESLAVPEKDPSGFSGVIRNIARKALAGVLLHYKRA